MDIKTSNHHLETQLWEQVFIIHVSGRGMSLHLSLQRFIEDKHTLYFLEHIHGVPGLQKASN